MYHVDNPKVVALREIGLDYYWMEDPKEIQIDVFKRQIALSKGTHLPFLLSIRDAISLRIRYYKKLVSVLVGDYALILRIP